jgi:asparagine synthase (glutamine-hydrolysing)
MVKLMESPRFHPEWYFKSELHKAAKNQVPDIEVVLLGQGANEFAGGYSRYLGSNLYEKENATRKVAFSFQRKS